MCSSRRKKKAWIELLSLAEIVRQSFEPRCAAVLFQILLLSFVAGRTCASADSSDKALPPYGVDYEQSITSVPNL